ncbi:hypothetical protein JL720_15628 [Aureococcus anophagefferens]|nr:hypothetical protein JL720_15628 [Aureococcus anophagefferens]
MGAASASTMLHMTAEDVCALAERRKRPRAICDAIRRHEIDGPTLLVLDAGDVAALAEASLDKKKLVGAFRELEAHLGRRHKRRGLDYVAAVASAAYATVPGAAPRPLRADGGTDTPRQPVEPCFAGRPSAPPSAKTGGRRASPTPCRAGALAAKGGDDAFLALRVDARDGRTTYARYVYGALALAAPKFRAARRRAGPFGAVSHAPQAVGAVPGPPRRAGGRRAGGRGRAGRAVERRGRRRPRRFGTPRAALVARHEAAGPPLDRRRQSSHDAVQRILFEGVVCEVRFALGPARETTS